SEVGERESLDDRLHMIEVRHHDRWTRPELGERRGTGERCQQQHRRQEQPLPHWFHGFPSCFSLVVGGGRVATTRTVSPVTSHLSAIPASHRTRASPRPLFPSLRVSAFSICSW